MFTGIIEEIGKIKDISSKSITVSCNKVLEDTKIGDSIAVNGVCLTVTKLSEDYFIADISYETYKVTSFSKLKTGDYVNLERALLCNSRLGGHFVSGHIDCISKLVKVEKIDNAFSVSISLGKDYAQYVISKGSISINGISLTIAECSSDLLNIAIIPHTYENTNLKYLKIGDFVNIEFDILSKYVEKFLSTRDNKAVIDMNFLEKNGF